MNINDFIALTNDQQLDTLQDQGVILHRHCEGLHRVTLFKVDDFYVELYFSLKEMRITMLSTIHRDFILNLYDETELVEAPAPAPIERYNHFSTEISFPAYLRNSLS